MSKQQCIICGCTASSACMAPTSTGSGWLPCGWLFDGHPYYLCTHCADPVIFKETNRPAENLLRVKEMNFNELFELLINLYLPPIIYYQVSKENITKVCIRFKPEHENAGLALLSAWFEDIELFGVSAYIVDLSRTVPLLEAAQL